MTQQAFIIRCAPSYISRVSEIVKANQIVIGWSKTKNELFDNNLNRESFKTILKNAYPSYLDNAYSLGQATGYLWRFIKEMQIGDYAIVPISKAFYLGEITSDLIYIPEKIKDDTSIRRNVKWLNNGKPIKREFVSAGLISRLKYQGTCVGATDLIEDIELSLKHAKKNIKPNFKNQLNESLKEKVQEFLVSKKSYLDDRKFEELIRQLMLGLGATTSNILPKTRYKDSVADIDVVASFIHLGIQIYIQVKKHSHESDEHAIRQAIEAIKIDNPDGDKPIYGWVVSSGKFNEKAEILANENGIRILNGDEIAEMIITVGLEKFK